MRHGAAIVVAASLAVTACGSSGSPTMLNTEKVERAIEHSSLAQRGQRVRVTCPSGVHQRKGLVFSCTALARRVSTAFTVTELDAAGHVHYEACAGSTPHCPLRPPQMPLTP
jgi:hypothetical protein